MCVYKCMYVTLRVKFERWFAVTLLTYYWSNQEAFKAIRDYLRQRGSSVTMASLQTVNCILTEQRGKEKQVAKSLTSFLSTLLRWALFNGAKSKTIALSSNNRLHPWERKGFPRYRAMMNGIQKWRAGRGDGAAGGNDAQSHESPCPVAVSPTKQSKLP